MRRGVWQRPREEKLRRVLRGGQVIPVHPEDRQDLQPLRRSDAEEVHAPAEGLAGQLAEQQPGLHDLAAGGLEDGAVLVEGGVRRGEAVQVGAETVGLEGLGDGSMVAPNSSRSTPLPLRGLVLWRPSAPVGCTTRHYLAMRQNGSMVGGIAERITGGTTS